jgi:pyroglutamyl-peptidase
MKKKRVALVTGFEPYGGMAHNPSAEIARRLHGARIGGVPVVGTLLPVDIGRLDAALKDALSGIEPVAVILLGLAPGETCIRLERVALNLADFPIPDNAGTKARDQPLDRRGPAALVSRLPLRPIEHRLLGMGIPARLSESAGTYLCNAAMYRALAWLPRRVPCGFIHLPLLPAQVAIGLESGGAAQPSMAFPVQRRAIEIALELSLDSGAPSRTPKA